MNNTLQPLQPTPARTVHVTMSFFFAEAEVQTGLRTPVETPTSRSRQKRSWTFACEVSRRPWVSRVTWPPCFVPCKKNVRAPCDWLFQNDCKTNAAGETQHLRPSALQTDMVTCVSCGDH